MEQANWNERIRNHQTQPEEEVWNNIGRDIKQLKAKRLRHRVIAASAVTVAIASASLLAWALSPNSTATEESANIASLQPAEVGTTPAATASEATLNLAAEPTSQPSETTVRPVASPTITTETPSEPAATTTDPVATSIEPQTVAVAEGYTNAPQPVSEPAKASTHEDGQPTAQPSEHASQPAEIATATPVSTTASTNSPSRQKLQPVTPESELVIWIPNVLSPDDQYSDEVRRFKVVPNSEASIERFEMFIYSRSGRLVFHTRDINQAWDGTYKGRRMEQGAYVYMIEYKDSNKGIHHTKGSVTLLR